ncbi:MAG: hypothetical protein ABIL09_00160, partial [Gemmatimonadota bacterium]
MARRREGRERGRRRRAAEVVEVDEAYLREMAAASPAAPEQRAPASQGAGGVPAPATRDDTPSPGDAAAAAAPASADARRRAFGPTGTARLVAEVSEAGDVVTLRELDLGGDQAVDAAAVSDALAEHYGVTAGVDQKALASLVDQAGRSGPVRGEFPVARAVPATPGQDG